jgi:hypothetical protein
MLIIETPIFTKLVNELMSDDEYRKLQEALVNRPDMGALIKNSGGLRKMRWAIEGHGKSGGIRVIYYWLGENDQLYMLLAYRKNQQENLTDLQIKTLKLIVERWS